MADGIAPTAFRPHRRKAKRMKIARLAVLGIAIVAGGIAAFLARRCDEHGLARAAQSRRFRCVKTRRKARRGRVGALQLLQYGPFRRDDDDTEMSRKALPMPKRTLSRAAALPACFAAIVLASLGFAWHANNPREALSRLE